MCFFFFVILLNKTNHLDRCPTSLESPNHLPDATHKRLCLHHKTSSTGHRQKLIDWPCPSVCADPGGSLPISHSPGHAHPTQVDTKYLRNQHKKKGAMKNQSSGGCCGGSWSRLACSCDSTMGPRGVSRTGACALGAVVRGRRGIELFSLKGQTKPGRDQRRRGASTILLHTLGLPFFFFSFAWGPTGLK
jgi:hypothetical protein